MRTAVSLPSWRCFLSKKLSTAPEDTAEQEQQKKSIDI
jgi:hypothetical protein